MRTWWKQIDWWLASFSLARALAGLVFMTYAAALPVLQQEWGMSATASGSISTGYHLGYTFSLVLFSWLADKWGPKSIFLGSMTAGGIVSLAFAFFAHDYLTALALYTLVGFSLGGTYTTGVMIMASLYPANRRGMAIGVFIAATSLGQALSLLVSGAALAHGGYRLSFLLTCTGPALAALLSWITLLMREVPKPAPRSKRKQGGVNFKDAVLKNRSGMLLVGGYAFHVWELLGMWAWTPAFLTVCLMAAGHDALGAAGMGSNISADFQVTGLLASLTMGTLSDRWGRSRLLFLLAALSTVCSFTFGSAVHWPFVLTITVGAVYAFTALGDSPILSVSITEVIDGSHLGAALGLRSLIGFGAGAVAPVAFGAVLDWAHNCHARHLFTGRLVAGLQSIGTGWIGSRSDGLLFWSPCKRLRLGPASGMAAAA